MTAGELEQSFNRIYKMMFAITSGGVILAFALRGWTWGAGVLLGAGASWLNFRWLKQIVESLGENHPTRKRLAVLAGLRYAILGAGAYVILKYSSISVPAALMGLFAPAAAVIAEIVIQLVYARI
jgi:hypothetical protein